jgi:hypothetical protein
MKKLSFLLILAFSLSSLQSQIVGISNDKLVVVGAEVIGPKTFEFEPGFGYLWSTKTFDENGKLVSLNPESDSTQVLQALGFRFTYGFAKNFEIGTSITSDLNTFGLGIKYTFLEKDRNVLAAFLGTTFSNESDFVLRNTGIFGKTASVGGGFAYMAKFSEKLSLDIDVQYQNVFDNKQSYSDDIFSAAEIGYRFPKRVQLIGGFNFRYNHFKIDRPDAWLLTFNPGITVNPGKSFVMILYSPFDLIGRNVDKFNGLIFALTITLQ